MKVGEADEGPRPRLRAERECGLLAHLPHEALRPKLLVIQAPNERALSESVLVFGVVVARGAVGSTSVDLVRG